MGMQKRCERECVRLRGYEDARIGKSIDLYFSWASLSLELILVTEENLVLSHAYILYTYTQIYISLHYIITFNYKYYIIYIYHISYIIYIFYYLLLKRLASWAHSSLGPIRANSCLKDLKVRVLVTSYLLSIPFYFSWANSSFEKTVLLGQILYITLPYLPSSPYRYPSPYISTLIIPITFSLETLAWGFSAKLALTRSLWKRCSVAGRPSKLPLRWSS
jgi:hypothetical protein